MSQPGTRTVNGQTPAFSGEMAWASNLYPIVYPSRYFNLDVASTEHEFNARKPLEKEAALWILAAPTPAEAKKRGNTRGRFTLRPDWDHGGRVRAMQDALVGKFTDPVLAHKLADTGTLHLAETGYWHDVFWGLRCFADSPRCRPECALPGVNMLGELLMALRTRIQTGDLRPRAAA